MATYCKAFLAKDLRQFAGWPADVQTAAPLAESFADPQAPHADPNEAILYLHDDYVVTVGAFRDDRTIFNEITPEWIEFCTGTLGLLTVIWLLPLPPLTVRFVSAAVSVMVCVPAVTWFPETVMVL